MAFDVIYDASDSKAKSQMTLDSRHTFQNKIYNIIQHQHSTFKGWDHTLRAAYEYNFSEKSNASITYNGSFSPDDTGQNYSGGNFQQSHIENRNDSYMAIKLLCINRSIYRIESIELIVVSRVPES